MRYLLLVAAGIAAAYAAAAFAAANSAHLLIAKMSPVVVSGTGFKARERVSLTVTSKATRTKRVVAGPRGGFKITFRGLSIAHCVAYSVTAKGNHGSTATLKVVPECAPARRVDTTSDPGLPYDPGAGKKHH